jgi:lipopolysaccharide transport system permease protein
MPVFAGIRLILSALMQRFEISPRAMVASVWRHRDLIAQMARREVVGRYRGSVLGIVWSFFHPVLMLTVYTFVFSVVFNARWQSGSDSKTEFAIVLFAGMIVYNLFAECINRAPGLVLANPNYVKKVVFPLEILPWVVFAAALFHAAVSLAVLLGFYALVNHDLQWTVVFLPVVLLPLVFLTLGLAWLFASLGVYLRDVGQTVGVATTVLMFLSPIFYPVTALPEDYRAIMYLNPLAHLIEQARAVTIWGQMPDWGALGFGLAVSLAVAWLGFAWFQKTRRGFADVL